MRILKLAVAFAFACTSEAIDYPYEFTFGGNPLAAHVSSADPSAKVWDDTVYVYTSKDGNLRQHSKGDGDAWTYEHMDGYHVFSTNDMVTWTDHGEILNAGDISWSPDGWQWAPCAARNNGKYYLYYPHKDFSGIWRVGVATANSPLGPFTDIGAPIDGATAIDPMVFTDDDGESYMYLNTAQVAKLKPNMIELAEGFRDINYASQSVQDNSSLHFEEGSYMHKYKGKYYYSYSNSNQAKPTAFYGIGDSPYGPFEWKGALAGQKFSSPDHHSIIEFKGDWYYFYHMDTPWEIKNDIDWYGFRRIACFQRMYYDGDEIELVDARYFHVNAGGDAYSSSDGMTFNWDHWYQNGSSHTFTTIVANTPDSSLYKSERAGSAFGYNVPITNGEYEITFYFAEQEYSTSGRRAFDVRVEGVRVIRNLDVFAQAGGKNRAHQVTITITVSDNELNIAFQGITNEATLCAFSAVLTKDLPGIPLLPAPPPSSSSTNSPVRTPTKSPLRSPTKSPVRRPTKSPIPPPAAPEFAPLSLDNVDVLDVSGIAWVSPNTWYDSYSVGDECYCETSFDQGVGDIVVETPSGDRLSVREICALVGQHPNGSVDRPRYNDVQCGNGPPSSPDEISCPGRTEYGAKGCRYAGPKWNIPATVTAQAVSLDITFRLINADTNEFVMNIVNGSRVRRSSLGLMGGDLNIEAVANSDVDSVFFVETGQNESVRPFAFCGDDGGNYFSCDLLNEAGAHTVTVSPSSSSGQHFPTVSVSFVVV